MALSFDSSDGCVLSVDSHRVVPAPFLTKTYQLVDDAASNDIVSWGEDGSTFVVWRPPEFARDLLPNYFKHNNFSSFVRQLNTYGFRKVVPDRWEFANDFFRKGERHLLCEIHRRKAQCSLAHLQHYGSLSPSTSGDDPQQLACNSSAAAAAAAAAAWSSSPLHSPRGICSASSTAAVVTATSLSLSDENERLRRDNCILLSELARLQKLYDDALLFLQHNMRSSPVGASAGDHDRLFPRTSAMMMSSATSRQPQLLRHQMPPPSPLSTQEHQTSSLIGGGMVVGSSKLLGMDAAAPRASTIDFVDGKLRELNAAAAARPAAKFSPSSPGRASVDDQQRDVEDDHTSPGGMIKSAGPKLFGVVLHGRKRLHPDQQADNQDAAVIKAAKIELELMPSTRSEAPWLKLRASRDDRVCI
ncbi:heat stress transcription factor B-4 [Selaginella moellendorffii]|uniref:heat stress transcription factor B-4 n=1 Tax=Selaginella moellendorffii TaxID=88036 RepID=UPI000D1D11C6|nr:heat stress transcription factor B-4 [Selaginella moellendorffii]|eukprot:XP_024530340.1 heat stress transcription factor B-4 [Selaginella moellendorffii]